MKKKILGGLAVVALGAAAIAGAVSLNHGLSAETKAATIKSYVKLGQGDTIAVGDVLVLASTANKKELSGISETSTTYGTVADYTAAPVGAFTVEVVAGSTGDSFAFKHDGSYLSWSSGNSLALVSVVNDNSSWTVTIGAKDVNINNVKDTARRIRYNSASPRFAAYTSNQSAVDLFREIETSDTKVTAVSLDKTFEVGVRGSNVTLTATVVPDTATDKSVVWTSSNESVATVADGVVSLVNYGYATITATTNDGGFTATCTVVSTGHAGTAEDPLNVSDGALVAEAAGTNASPSKYYVTGNVKDDISITTNNGATCHIVDEDDNELYLYRFKDIGNVNFTDTTKIKAGDTVVVLSSFYMYNSAPQGAYGELISCESNVKLTSIAVTGAFDLPQYVGEPWDLGVYTVTGTYSDASQANVTGSATVTPSVEVPTEAGELPMNLTFTVEDISLVVPVTMHVYDPSSVTADHLTYAGTQSTVTTAGYAPSTFAGAHANYAINSYRSSTMEELQIRTKNSDSGIVSASLGGRYAKSVTITPATAKNCKVYVYASETPFESPADLFDVDLAPVATLSADKTKTNLPLTAKYVGIRSVDGASYMSAVDIEYVDYTAWDVAMLIRTLAGGWYNEVETSDCAAHYRAAKEAILLLDAEELLAFQNGVGDDMVAARYTYAHWCEVNGDPTPYSGEIVTAAHNAVKLETKGATAIVAIGVILSFAALAAAMVIVRKRRHN